MAENALAQLFTAAGAAGAGAVVLRIVDIIASRRASAAGVEATYSADAREWAETFRAELAAQSERHAREIGSLVARIESLETRLATSEASRAALVEENRRLESEVHRLTLRVAELERGAPHK